MDPYDYMHEVVLPRERGSARRHPCIECGRGNCWWAYQYTGEMLRSPKGSAYSEDPSDYAPMCNGCHARLDWKDPVRRARGEVFLRAQAQQAGILGAAAKNKRLREDPEYAARQKEHGRWMGKTYGSQGGKREGPRDTTAARAALKARRESDPDFKIQLTDSGRKRQQQNGRKALQSLLLKDPLNQSRAGRAGGLRRSQMVKSDPDLARSQREVSSKNGKAVVRRRRQCETCGLTTSPPALGTHQKYSGHTGWGDL